MNKTVLTFFVITFLTAGAHAQPVKSLKDIEKEILQAKSTATAAALIERISETIPQTDADVVALGRLMDKYPTQGQKALAKIKNPKLAKAIQTECAGRIDKFKADNKDWSKLPAEERMSKINSYMASQAMMTALGNLKNRESLPFLKQYITPEYDGTFSYTASIAIGRIAPDDPALFKELWDTKDVKSINYGAYGHSMLKEVAQKLQEPGISGAEKDNLRAKAKVELMEGRTPEEKQLLKEIVLHHSDGELRKQAGEAVVKSLMFHPSQGDVDFVLEWTKNPKEASGGFSMTYMRDHFDNRFVPVIIRYLREGDNYDRGKAVELISQYKIKETLPLLKECIIKDRDSSVRGGCRMAYWKITGEMIPEFTPQDAAELEAYLNNPRMIAFHEKMDDNNPRKKKFHALKAALEKYKGDRGR